MFAKSSPGMSAARRSRAAQSPGVRSAWVSSCRRARSAASFCWRSSSRAGSGAAGRGVVTGLPAARRGRTRARVRAARERGACSCR